MTDESIVKRMLRTASSLVQREHPDRAAAAVLRDGAREISELKNEVENLKTFIRGVSTNCLRVIEDET